MHCPAVPMVVLAFALHGVPGRAQETGAEAPPRAETTAAPDPSLSATSVRVVLGGGAGLLVEIGALVGGYILSYNLCALSGPLDCNNAGALAITLTPPLLLMPLTVWAVGSLLDGRAAYWPALLGGLGGALLSAALIPTGNADLIPLGLVLPVAGALIGFELHHRHRRAPVVMPFVHSDSAGLAISGAF